MTESLRPEQLAEYRALAEQIAADPWVLSDCEGWLKIWRESALTHIVRDETGEIDGFSEPSSHRVTDLVVEIELDSWDPGENKTDDQIRTNVGTLFTAREALPALLAEVARLAARVARLEQSEAAGQRVITRMSREARALEDELVRRQRRITDLADRTETAETHIAELEQAIKAADEEREATIAARAEQAGGER